MKTPARLHFLHAIAAVGLLLGGSGTATSRADILYAVNLGGNTIEKFTPGGTGSVFASSGLSVPYGLAFDSVGNLYVANVGNNTIVKFTPGGTGLDGPEGLAFDSAGNLYAANRIGSTIEKFTPDGDGSVFASSGLSTPAFLAFTNDVGVPLKLANQVPEPTSAVLLLGSGAMILQRRRHAVTR